MLPKKSAFVYIVVSNEEKLRTWDDSYILALRQRTVWQKIIVASAGTLPRYLYSNKTSDVAETSDETTEADSANMVRPSDMEKEVLQPDWAEWSAQIQEHRERASRSIWLCKWRGGWFTLNIDQYYCWTKGLFFVGWSSRFGRLIKIDLRFFS